MIEPAPSVGRTPVARAITPPRIELFRLRHEHAHGIDPTSRDARRGEFLAFDRRVRINIQHLLVAPYVVLERRDVEIADQDRALVARRMQMSSATHLIEES